MGRLWSATADDYRITLDGGHRPPRQEQLAPAFFVSFVCFVVSLRRMVKSTGTYLGGLNCQLTHGPSGQTIDTDAPKDNQGRGAAFSPTDLLCASLASCMVTTMAIAARNRLGTDIPGVKWEVTKEMSTDAPRRIVRIATQVWLPFPKSKDPEGILERAALACPVKRSLAAEVETPVVFHWAE